MSTGLIRVLLQQNIINTQQAQYYEQQTSLFTALFADGITTPVDLAMLLSRVFVCPVLDLRYFKQPFAMQYLGEEQCLQEQCLPLFYRDKRLFLAVADPTRIQDYQKLMFASGHAVELVVVRHDQLMMALEVLQRRSTALLQNLSQETLDNRPPSVFIDETDEEDGPIARFVHKTLLDALNVGASDIHFEFYEHSARVRFRIDGQLREANQPPLSVHSRLASRIKIMAKIDISEKRIPQDGRMHVALQKQRRLFDIRVSTLPTVHGEKVVMRILSPESVVLGIEKLGLETFQKEQLLEAVNRPHGMILVTGPTGSGKTVSLYACLQELNTENVNISTAEDPVEISLLGINQVNVNEKQGLTFATALRAFLRQDPDIIMVGEIRDLETADIAIKAAQTGHMVFSTLHTNDAPSTLSRLLNMGVAPFNIASSVSLIVAQRLLRCLCPHCKKPSARPPEAVLRQMGFRDEDLAQDWVLYRAEGCDACHGKGYKGRVGIFELMPVSDAMQRLILEGGHDEDIQELAYREGMVDLRRAGLLKVMAGQTSLEEVLARTNH